MEKEKILRLFDLIPKNSLYLSYHKEHLDPNNKLSDKEWKEFVEESSDRLFEYCEEEGKELLEVWSIERN
jgi:DNA-dependent RNA polymerase auxiliary subunit epsilon